ncbi:MAG TPA: non-homologous end-joining DNA ligase [Lacunisphaera sp.]|nr:non-homologous end-joining DNA ligase [Lacunisphaera sp.]
MARAKPSRSAAGVPRALGAYRRKRNLRRSGEPAGGAAAAGTAPQFVVQKHDASHLHYDFRLEAGGVLKSWAVPKGLPQRAGDEALAVEVEDHPLDYGGFEGTIPEGNYGAGTVMLWDRGAYALEGGDFARAHRQGKLHVALAGRKLRGEWTLVRLRPRGREARKNWLVIKNRSLGRLPRAAGEATAPRGASVLTGRTMREIAGGPPTPKRTRRAAATKAAAPAFVEPMKALGVTAVPDGDWHLEIKFDGYRALAALQRGRGPRLWSRNGRALGADYPEVVAGLAEIACRDALLDGEIVALDERGRSSFQLLQRRAMAENRPPICYYAFDLLRLNGRDLRDEPIETRRQELAQLLSAPPDAVRLSPVFQVTPRQLLQEVARAGLEGIVAKAAESRYEPGRRSGAWLKCRIAREQEVVIGGFTPPEGGRRHFGALLVGYYQDKKLRYAGKVGTGFDDQGLDDLFALFRPRRRHTTPFAREAGDTWRAETRGATWLKPDLVGQVRFAEWTQGGRLRHPVFLGLRRDKPAAEVVREAVAADAGRKRS